MAMHQGLKDQERYIKSQIRDWPARLGGLQPDTS